MEVRTLACRHVEPEAVPDRRFCRGVGLICASYLALVREDAPQRTHEPREPSTPCAGSHAGAPWRMMPNDFPPWKAVYQQTRRWLNARVFEAMVHDLRAFCCAGSKARHRTRPQRCSTVVRCAPRPRAATARATMGRSARGALSCIWWWTLWAIRWHCGSHRPPSRIERG